MKWMNHKQYSYMRFRYSSLSSVHPYKFLSKCLHNDGWYSSLEFMIKIKATKMKRQMISPKCEREGQTDDQSFTPFSHLLHIKSSPCVNPYFEILTTSIT